MSDVVSYGTNGAILDGVVAPLGSMPTAKKAVPQHTERVCGSVIDGRVHDARIRSLWPLPSSGRVSGLSGLTYWSFGAEICSP